MLNHIALGTDFKEYYNYDGNPLPIRPLSTFEMDEILKKSVGGVSPFIFDKWIEFKLGLLEEDEEIELNQDNYNSFLDFNSKMDHWIVYYSMKDFQPTEFSKPDYEGEFEDDFDDWSMRYPKGYYQVRKMKHVHEIADRVISMTIQPETKLMEVLTNDQGVTLATMVHAFHVPLTDKAWKLTPLQTKFIFFSRPGAPEIVEDVSEIPGITGGTMEEITKKLREMVG